MAIDNTINTGSSTAGKANVDVNYNLQVRTPTNAAQAGYTWLASLNDAGSITGSPDVHSVRSSDDGRLSVGMDTAVFDDSFNALAQNTNLWQFFSLNSLIATQSGGYLNINPTQVVTSGGVVSMKTYRQFYLAGNNTLHIEFSVAFGTANTPLANQIYEFGLFVPPATAVAPPDGVFFRYTSAGLNGIMVNNSGAETTIATPRACSNFQVDTNYHAKMIIHEDFVDFYVDGIEIGSFNVPAGFGAPFLSGAQPIGIIARNTALISGTNGTYLKISDLHIDQNDMQTGKNFAQIYGGMGRHSSVGQNGGTMGSTAALTNSQAKGTPAILSNTTCAAPACVGLGGQAAWLPTLTAFSDGIVMSYLNPVGGVNQQPRTLYIGAVRMDAFVTTILAGGPVSYLVSLAYGHTAISLATAEATSFTTGGGKAPRRLHIGALNFPVTSAVGAGPTQGNIDVSLASPIVINPGEYVQIVLKNVGVVTTTGDMTAHIACAGWWE